MRSFYFHFLQFVLILSSSFLSCYFCSCYRLNALVFDIILCYNLYVQDAYREKEIGLYYLHSRYYDAQVGRFVNGDRTEFSLLYRNLSNNNLFSFCKNDAINNMEFEGYFSLSKKFKSIAKYFSIGWTQLTITLPKNLSIALAVLGLIYKIKGIVGNLKDIKNFANGDKLTTAVVAAIPYGSTYITSEFIAWIANIGAVAAVISMAFSVVMACWTGGIGNIIQLILDFIVSYFIPPIISLVLMLYYGIAKNKGSKYIFKYWGGASIAF